MYTMGQVNEEMDSHIPKFDEPFGVRFYFENFWGTDVGWCEGHTLG
jgi:hypothetical protein